MLKQDYMDPKSKKAVEITHAIAIWICKNLHAYSTVEEKEFVALINLLEPRYKVPCRTTFSRSIILKLYNSLKAKEAAYFKIVKDKLESINATIDMWTSDTAKDSYISLTVQFVDPECEQVSFSVECEPFPGVHSGTTVLQKVEWMLAEKLGLEPEIVDQPEIYITADNGPNIAAALAEPTEQKLLDPKVPAELKKKRMWFYIRCLNHTLQLLGSSTEVTFSTVIPVLFEIKSSLEDFIRKAKKGTGVMFARKVLSKLEERFPDCDYKDNELYQTGMVVDPRFKDILISSFDGDKTAHFLLERKALEKHRRHIRRGWVRMEETNSEEQVTAAASPKTIKKSRFSHFAKVGQNKSDTSTTADVITSIRNEVESYLQLKTEDEDCDPLEWWKQHKNDFPHIYPLARHYLGLCPTEVPSERMFSVGGNTCTKKRSRLLPDHVKEIIYIHDNYDMLMRLSKIYDLK
ncbi:Zinc finger BED domain-containing protein 4 [Frankliniella fusca]|uniref:Zinc finger BED domain-containing protein 4 n=1 Tax=Frankliniella fusca TaxID=407009 RepID=A0AAE1I2L1_9NEOP|nr:Zinc finger BED domain-containing protein 4 [Frankliniella fusca]